MDQELPVPEVITLHLIAYHVAISCLDIIFLATVLLMISTGIATIVSKGKREWKKSLVRSSIAVFVVFIIRSMLVFGYEYYVS